MGMSKKVLVVDDETHILQVVSLKLRNAGFEVVTATDGEEALDVMATDRPDLLITDLQMPVMNGVELCCRMRDNPALRDVPAMMLTARGYSLEPEDMSRTGLRAVLSKPFSPRELLATVQEILGPATDAVSADAEVL